jgi:flagellar protein FlaG
MSTISIDNSPKSTPVAQQNPNQTDKVNTVGNTQATQKITEKATLPVQEVQEITEHLNHLMKDLNVNLSFEVNKEAGGELIIKVVDIETKQVIRQFPTEETLHLRKTLDSTQGIILRTEA